MKTKIRLSESDLLKIIKRVIESEKKHVVCQRCDWEWDIEPEDKDPYLCHMCGHRNSKQENKEGVGPYDAPAFEMQPDHVHFKKLYNEQNGDEPQYVNIIFSDEDLKKSSDNFINAIPSGPGKIINKKFYNKKQILKDGPLTVEYTIFGLGEGKNFNGGTAEDFEIPNGTNIISGWITIQKVIYKNQDVSDFYDFISLGRRNKNDVYEKSIYDAEKKVLSFAKLFGINTVKMR